MDYLMKKRLGLMGFLFLIMITICSPTLAYPDEDGSCRDEHGVSLIDAIYDAEISLTIDGDDTDSAWTEYSAFKINVPLASDSRETEFYVVYMDVLILLDNQYLYILCEWDDTTTQRGVALNYDGLFFCWNIDVPNFSSEFWDGMYTEDMGGGTVDSWSWYYGPAAAEPGTEYEGKDMCFGNNGWYALSIEDQDVLVAYSYEEGESYLVEMRRKLITGDKYDVQFDHIGVYDFNMAVINDGYHQDHAISWTYGLNIEELPPSIPGYPLLAIILLSLSSISIIISKFNHK